MNDWKTEIVNGVLVHQRLQALDTQELWSYRLPEVAATEVEILALERRLGVKLDARYRAFLLHANGWRNFYQDVDIFGTAMLMDGPGMRAARRQLSAVVPDVFRDDVGLAIEDVLPIAASEKQSDMFLLGLPGSAADGTVIWFAGYTIERFPSFDMFFLSMLDYNRLQIQQFERNNRH